MKSHNTVKHPNDSLHSRMQAIGELVGKDPRLAKAITSYAQELGDLFWAWYRAQTKIVQEQVMTNIRKEIDEGLKNEL